MIDPLANYPGYLLRRASAFAISWRRNARNRPRHYERGCDQILVRAQSRNVCGGR
jgi:hypothetical protein